jgi:hypothetical protein
MSVCTALDFARSSCTWLLKDQPSYGRFAIDATLTLPGIDTFYLCAQVFAGNVYGAGALFKDPPYEFSVVFSTEKIRIFRDTARNEPISDSVRSADEYAKVQLSVATSPCRKIEFAELASLPPGQWGRLSARIRTREGAGLPVQEMEFPIRHVNVDPVARRFQIETGPVLVLNDGDGEPLSRLRRAYVNFGQPDRAEFLVDSDRPSAPPNRWSQCIGYDCEVCILESSNGS